MSSRPASSKSAISNASLAIAGSRPASSKSVKSHVSAIASRAGSAAGSRVPSRTPSAVPSLKPSSARSSRSIAASVASSRPASAKAWTESETTPSSPRSQVSNDDFPLLEENGEPQKGCWHSFTHLIGGMWSTREMTPINVDKEIYVRTTIRELVVYCIFIAVLCIITFGMQSKTQFYYTKVMTDLFQDQPEIKNHDDFWTFMEGQLLDGLYWEYWFNDGMEKSYICPGGEERKGPCPINPSDRNVLFENRLLGLPRLRQLRVKNDSCEVHPHFQRVIENCYAEFNYDVVDEGVFGFAKRVRADPKAWMYQSPTDLGVDGVLDYETCGSITCYSNGGAVQNLFSLKNETSELIHELKESLWISRATRAVILDFAVYNANVNLFCVVKLIFEFPAVGGVIPSNEFMTVKLIRYVDTWDYIILAFECVYYMFVVYYIVEEVLEIVKVGWSYFTGFWNNLDIVVIVLCVFNIALNLYTYFVVSQQLETLLKDPDKYADFTNLGKNSTYFKSAVAICVFFSWVKLFKYISFNKTMTQLASTLARCAGDVAGFGVMFFIVFFAFAQLGYMIFGSQVKDYSTMSDAVFTLLRTILGDFDFYALENANRVLGPIFFLAYVFFVFFVLLNMFLAIINDTYSEVKEEIATQKNDFEIADYFKRGYNNMLGKVGKRSKLIDIENALKLANADGLVTFEEVRQNLKKCNFSDMEIEMFFAKYDVDGDGEFSYEEGQQLVEDLENDRIDQGVRPESGRRGSQAGRPMTAGASTINHEEFGMLTKRVERMEGVIGNIVSKIDKVLIKLESMEKSKSKKKQNLGKLFDGLTNEDGDDVEKRKQMEEMILNWETDSRPATSGNDD